MNKIEQGKKDIQNIRLSTQERERLLSRILKNPLPSPYQPVWHTWVSVRVGTYALALLLISTGTGSTLTLAAEGSVPGDILYPLKISVTEPVRSALTRSPEDKAVWEVEQIERRLNEAVRLAAKNELTEERALALEKKLRKNETEDDEEEEKSSNGKDQKVEKEAMSSFTLTSEDEQENEKKESSDKKDRKESQRDDREERDDLERLYKLEEVARERINKQREEMRKSFEDRLSEREKRDKRERD